MTPEILAGCMFLVVVLTIFTGIPVAFVLGGVSLIFGGIGIALDMINPIQLTNIVPRIFGSVISSNVLVAVPLFIYMGTILERTRIAEDLLTGLGWSLRRVPGGLAVAVTLLGTIMAATTGIVGASVVMLSMMALPLMRRARYSKPLSYGTVAASGTLGILIPPSIMLVILGDQMQIPVGALFAGALLPGILLSVFYVIYIVTVCSLKPSLYGQVPSDAFQGANPRRKLFMGLVPPSLLIVSVLGSVLFGFATPTEAAGVGVVGALILGLVYRRLGKDVFFSSIEQSARTNGMVFFIFFGATAFAFVFRILDGEYFVMGLLAYMGIDSVHETVLLVMCLVFVLGFFFDFIEIALIVLPIFIPVLSEMDIADVFGSAQLFWVWFAMLMSINLQTSFLTPPFGFTLFYLKGSDPAGIRLFDVYLGIIPFVLIQLTALVIIYLWPDGALWLPVTFELAE